MADNVPSVLTWDHDSTHKCFPHEWTLVDLTPNYLAEMGQRNDDWYLCVVCENCNGIRCSSFSGDLRCEMVRHHTTPHLYPDNTSEPVGG